MKSTRVKKAAMTDIGQQLANAKDEFDLAFDKIKDLIFVATALKPWKQDTGLLVYQKLVLGTRKQKDRDTKRGQIAIHVRPYRKMLEAYHARIVQEDLTWIVEGDIEIVTGNSKSAKLPLTKVYEWCLKNDESSLGTLEANLYYIFRYLTDKEKEAAQHAALVKICDEFQMEEDTSMDQATANIVNKVKRSLPAGKVGEEASMDTVTAIVKGLVGDGNMEGDMGGLASGLLSGQLTIPQLIENVKRAVESSQGAQAQTAQETQSAAIESVPVEDDRE